MRRFCLYFWHDWRRYGELVEQYGTGGYGAWHQCQKCKQVDFKLCDKYVEQVKFIVPEKKP